MTEMETAEQFAMRMVGDHWRGRGFGDLAALIKADRASAKVAVLLELQGLLMGFYKRNPDHVWTRTVPASIESLMAKYTTTEPAQEAECDQRR